MSPAVIDPRELLRDEFTRRTRTNERYSLRAFAQSLGISHTVLSLVMSGKRPLSKRASQLVAERLGLSPIEAQRLHQARVTRTAAAHPSPKHGAGATTYEYERISLETFHLISDWVHYAILSLLEVEGFRFDPKWMAQRLGVGEMAVRSALDRLLALRMIEKKGNRWRQSTKPIKVENEISTGATRNFQKSLLGKAVSSLENDAMELRDFSSMTFAMDPALIPFAKDRIRAFRRELTAELEAKGKAKEVYSLTVQIFPLSKVTKDKK